MMPRYAIFSDVHGNIDALDAVLEDIEKKDAVDKMICLGDLVGYGARPVECVRRIRQAKCEVVVGNHDYAAVGKMSLYFFNELASEAMLWTREQLGKEETAFLDALPLVYEDENMVAVHGTLVEPESFGYVLSDVDAVRLFATTEKDFCFTGHSHFPCVFIYDGGLHLTRDSRIVVPEGARVIVNVGSVGQPRDGDPRACYVIFDSDNRLVETVRVAYDVEAAAAKIREAGLPPALAERLLVGM